MDWKNIQTKLRRDPLTIGLLNHLKHNMAFIGNGSGHNNDGTHNSIDVPRAVGGFTQTAGVYAIDSGSTGFIASIVKNGVGDVTVNFDAGKVVDAANSPVRVRVSIQDNALESKPCCWTVEPAGSNAIRVHLFKLSSALGAGNTWAAADLGFALSVNSRKYADASSAIAGVTSPVRGNSLGVDAGNWNQYVENIATLRARQLVGHREGGTHNVREVARAFSIVRWDGALYSLGSRTAAKVLSVSRDSLGIATITLAGGGAFTTPYQVLASVDYKRSTTPAETGLTLYCIGTSAFASTTFKAYLFQYDFVANTWARADADWVFTIHQAPY